MRVPAHLLEMDFIARSLSLPNRTALVKCGFNSTHAGESLFPKRVSNTPDSYGLNIVLEGSGVYIDNEGHRHELNTGSVFQRMPGIIHSTDIDTNALYAECTIGCDSETYTHLCAVGLITTAPPVHALQLSLKLVRQVEDFLAYLHTHISPPALDCMAHFTALLSHCFTTSVDVDDPLRRAAYLLSSDLEQSFSAREVAAELHIGYEKFRRDFKIRFGCAPGAYRIRQRIERACELLSTHSVNETASLLGYSTQFKFSAQFKKQTGFPPSTFQRLLRTDS